MKELVVISGKGGTGKTSLTASFAALTRNKVIVDCDVDAADMHLLIKPYKTESTAFFGGKQAEVITAACTACGKCFEFCRFDAIYPDGPANAIQDTTYRVDPIGCEGCGVCAWFCPSDAIAFEPVQCGQWMISQTAYGPMVHAKLGVAAENSGKLVSTVRAQARDLAEQNGYDLIIIDGAPGVGCSVIASVTGVDMALVVTEPTASGFHDLNRVLELLWHFEVPSAVCINKCDINPDMTATIRTECESVGIPVVGSINYSDDVIPALIAGKPVVEHAKGPIVSQISNTWAEVRRMLLTGQR